MSDIVERLRELARNYADGVAGMEPQDHFVWEAADEIEQLRAQIARDEEHYQAAMTMNEKHRKLWVEVCQENTHLRTALSSRLRLLRHDPTAEDSRALGEKT